MIFKNRCFLYKIKYNNLVYNITNNNGDIIFNNEVYYSEFISHSSIISSVDISKNNVDITISNDFDIVDDFLFGKIRTNIELYIYEHINQEFEFVFKGEITDMSINNREVKLHSVFLANKLKKVANRFKYQSLCNHILFDNNCGLDDKDFKIDTVVKDIKKAGTEIVIDSFGSKFKDPQFFRNGKIVSLENNNAVMILNVFEDTNTVRLLNISTLSVGDRVSLYIGCNKNYNDCKNKFNNIKNMTAEGSIPNRNPFAVNIN